MDTQLLKQALIKFSAGLLLVAALVFIPAGTLHYWQAWLLLCTLFVPMLIAGFVMLRKAPELLRKRLNAREQQAEQKYVLLLSGLMFIAAFLIAGFSRRFSWPMLPDWASWAAAAVFLLAYALFGEVLRENEYLSRTVEVQQGQRVIDTGLYGIVRHPMYMSTLLLFLMMPLILGSPISFAVTLLYLPIIALRIRNEERVLEAGLPGYTEYMRRVKYRIIPYVW